MDTIEIDNRIEETERVTERLALLRKAFEEADAEKAEEPDTLKAAEADTKKVAEKDTEKDTEKDAGSTRFDETEISNAVERIVAEAHRELDT